MNPIQALLQAVRKKRSTEQPVVPQGFCPNCWGSQEYGGKFYEAVKNHLMSIDEKDPRIGWVEEYYEKHLANIHLRPKDEEVVCRQCKVTYKPVQDEK